MCLDLLRTQTLRAKIWQKAREPNLHPWALLPLSKTFRNTSFDCPPPSLSCQSPPSHPRTPYTYLSHIQFWNSSPISISNFRFIYRGDVQNQSYRRAPASTQFKLRTVAKLEDLLDSALLSQVSDQLSLTKKVPEAVSRPQKKEVRDFEWPFDELKVLVDSDKEAVNVKDDSDLIEEFGNGSDGEACSPFRHFELISVSKGDDFKTLDSIDFNFK